MAREFDKRPKPADLADDQTIDASLRTNVGEWERVVAGIRQAVGQEHGTVIIEDFERLDPDLRRQFEDALSTSQAIGYTEKK